MELNEENEVCLFIPPDSSDERYFEVISWSVYNENSRLYESRVFKSSLTDIHSNYMVRAEECIHSGIKVGKENDGSYSFYISTIDKKDRTKIWIGDFMIHTDKYGVITLGDEHKPE